MPTGTNIVDDLCYSGKFKSSENPDISSVHIPFVNNYRDYSDMLHTNRVEQYVFDTQKTANDLIGDKELYDSATKSVKAHEKLEEYVKDKHLYYAFFHTKKHQPLWKGGSEKEVYIFAVGVSPYGNPVGVISMNLGISVTGSGPVPNHNKNEEEDEEDDNGDDEEQEPDPRAIMVNSRPGPLPDGSPQHIFSEKENESSLSSRLMLNDGHKGVVSFEGMLPACTLLNFFLYAQDAQDVYFPTGYARENSFESFRAALNIVVQRLLAAEEISSAQSLLLDNAACPTADHRTHILVVRIYLSVNIFS